LKSFCCELRCQREIHVTDGHFKRLSGFGDDLHDAETAGFSVGIFGFERHGELQIVAVEQGGPDGAAFARAQVDAGFVMIRQFKFAQIFIGEGFGRSGDGYNRCVLRRRILGLGAA